MGEGRPRGVGLSGEKGLVVTCGRYEWWDRLGYRGGVGFWNGRTSCRIVSGMISRFDCCIGGRRRPNTGGARASGTRGPWRRRRWR